MEDFWEMLEAKNDERYGKGKWHCDDIWESKDAPECVIAFLDVKRAPAHGAFTGKSPTLFATFEGKGVRVVMASRMGDVGITENLKAGHGYDLRVYLPQLSDFSKEGDDEFGF